MPESSLPTPRPFRAVYDGHFDFVWRFAASRGVLATALEDVVRDVFVAVHGQVSGFEQASTLRVGIASVSRHVVQRHLRKNGKLSPPEPPTAEELTPVDELGADEPLHDKTPGELLGLVLDKMSESQREAFILRDMEGLSMAETSEILGVNENTLRVWLHDARTVFNGISALVRAQRFWVTREGENA